jgi:hypothetical protein
LEVAVRQASPILLSIVAIGAACGGGSGGGSLDGGAEGSGGSSSGGSSSGFGSSGSSGSSGQGDAALDAVVDSGLAACTRAADLDPDCKTKYGNGAPTGWACPALSPLDVPPCQPLDTRGCTEVCTNRCCP